MSSSNSNAARPKARQHRYRSDGTSIWNKAVIHGPGVWATCVKGKERQTAGELYDLFESLAEELWPSAVKRTGEDASGKESDDDGDDIASAVAKEVAALKRPRKEKMFANCPTDTPCAIFIHCKPPVDPVAMIQRHMRNVEQTGITKTRYTFRLIPITNTCDANAVEVTNLCNKVITPYFEKQPDRMYRYKIDLRIRNHNTLSRDEFIKIVAKSVPEGHKVDLENPEVFILVEAFKTSCGIGIVDDYYKYKKYNAIEVAQARSANEPDEDGPNTQPR